MKGSPRSVRRGGRAATPGAGCGTRSGVRGADFSEAGVSRRGEFSVRYRPPPCWTWRTAGSSSPPLLSIPVLVQFHAMSTPCVNPQAVLHSALPVGTSLVVVFVPSKDRDGKPIDQDRWVDEVLTTLGRL